jgi:hypothetical protein
MADIAIEQRKEEKQAAIDAEKAAKLELQRNHEQAKKEGETNAPAKSPVAENDLTVASGRAAAGLGATSSTIPGGFSDKNDAGTVKTRPSPSRESSTPDSRPDPGNTAEIQSPAVIETQMPQDPSHNQPTIPTHQAANSETSGALDAAEIAVKDFALSAEPIPTNANGPETSTANKSPKGGPDDFSVLAEIDTASTDASTASQNYTTAAAPEGRTTGSRAANSGPQEVPRTIADETKIDASPALSPVAMPTVQNGHAKPLTLANRGRKEDEILPVQQQVERWKTLKSRSSTT